MTCVNPNDIDKIIASGAALTEAKLSIAKAQGISSSLFFSSMAIPAGNIQPKKKDTGKSSKIVIVNRQKVLNPIKRFRNGSSRIR